MQAINSTISDFQITSLSDRSVLVTFGNVIDRSINERVLLLYQTLLHSAFEGFIESVPAYSSIAVFYDQQKIKELTRLPSFDFVKKYLQQLLQQSGMIRGAAGRMLKIPVCYDTSFGTDINHVADNHQLSIDEVITLHTSVIYRVYMIGFMPGFAYMGTIDEKLINPRKARPAMHVPAGSVGIAGSQTGIYPIDSPGGWQIIGRTPMKLFDTGNLSPCLLTAGDNVQFISIDKKEFKEANGH